MKYGPQMDHNLKHITYMCTISVDTILTKDGPHMDYI